MSLSLPILHVTWNVSATKDMFMCFQESELKVKGIAAISGLRNIKDFEKNLRNRMPNYSTVKSQIVATLLDKCNFVCLLVSSGKKRESLKKTTVFDCINLFSFVEISGAIKKENKETKIITPQN